MSALDAFLYTHPWIAIMWSLMTDALDFFGRHPFEIIIVFLLFSIRNSVQSNSLQPISLYSFADEVKDALEKVNGSIKEISDAITPIIRDRQIEIGLRDGRIKPHEARIAREG